MTFLFVRPVLAASRREMVFEEGYPNDRRLVKSAQFAITLRSVASVLRRLREPVCILPKSMPPVLPHPNVEVPLA